MSNEVFYEMEETNDLHLESEEEMFKVTEDHTYNLIETKDNQEYETEVTPYTPSHNMQQEDKRKTLKSSHYEAVKLYKYQCAMYKDKMDRLGKISEKNQDKIKQLSKVISHLRMKFRNVTARKSLKRQ